MSPLSEQFSEARKLQLETQFDFFRNFTGKAIESAEKLIALNLDASRTSLEQSSKLVRQMIEVKDPRDLFALSSQAQSPFAPFDTVLSYGRQLFGIAAGAATVAVPGFAAAAPAAPALGPAPALAPAPAPAPAPAAAAPAAPAPRVETKTEPAIEVAPAPAVEVELLVEPALVVEAKSVIEAKPIAEQNPVAKALAQAGGNAEALKPSAASFPVRSSAQPIAVESVKPVDAAPPAAQASGTPSVVTAKATAPGTKAARKK